MLSQKNLGLTLDSRLTFREHLQNVLELLCKTVVLLEEVPECFVESLFNKQLCGLILTMAVLYVTKYTTQPFIKIRINSV